MIIKIDSPQVARSLEQIKPAKDKNIPGLIFDIKEIAKLNPSILSSLGISATEQKANTPIFIQPKHVPYIYQNFEDLSAIKSLAALGLTQIDARLKTGLDIIWLAVGASKLVGDWKSGEVKKSDLYFKTTGLAFDVLGVAGAISPSLMIPDNFLKPANFVYQVGKTLYAGDEVNPPELIPKTGVEPYDTLCKGIGGVLNILDPKTDSNGITVKALTPFNPDILVDRKGF
jgi:hypothetical protein